jgi:hypothetical protein
MGEVQARDYVERELQTFQLKFQRAQEPYYGMSPSNEVCIRFSSLNFSPQEGSAGFSQRLNYFVTAEGEPIACFTSGTRSVALLWRYCRAKRTLNILKAERVGLHEALEIREPSCR